ncbi:DUF2783 domain-containing protein [Polycladidibacter stylochi]|uniref:DUF2783 domain-containing protein n=1 Tax=Polycladidibacter stylochi TaxID=1807766 RepID=UPI0008314321|nr:DUF2783 domain-containing protein [Pseudovibrio stylochi]
MSQLVEQPNLNDPDGFYQELIDSHTGLSDAQSTSMNARLVLILANHIGDRAVLAEALALAKETMPTTERS